MLLLITSHLNDPNNEYGGVVKSFPRFCEAIVKDVDRASVMGLMSQTTSLDPLLENNKKLKCIGLRSAFPKNRHAVSWQFIKIWNAIKISDTVILNGFQNFLMTLCLLFCLVQRKQISVHFRGGLELNRQRLDTNYLKRLWNYLFLKSLLKNLNIIYCSSQIEQRNIQEYLSQINFKYLGNMIIIENSVTNENLTQKSKYSNTFKLLYFGRISPEKRTDFLIEFATKNEWELHLYGPIIRSNYKSQLLNNEMTGEKIFYNPPVNLSIIAENADKYDCFVNVSVSENFGNVFVEAAKIKLPIISTKVGVLDRLISNEEFIPLEGFDLELELKAALKKLTNLTDAEKAKMARKASNKLENP